MSRELMRPVKNELRPNPPPLAIISRSRERLFKDVVLLVGPLGRGVFAKGSARCLSQIPLGVKRNMNNPQMILGIHPTCWTNDDFPEIGNDIPYQVILDQTVQAGFAGGSTGHNYP